MKVLNIQPFDYLGSIQRRSLQVASELKKEGIQTTFLTPKAEEKERLFSTEAVSKRFRVYRTNATRPIHITDLYSSARMIRWLMSFPRTMVQLYRIFKAEQAQVIQINGLICAQEAIAMCLLARKKVVWVLISNLYPRFVIFVLLPLIRCVGKRVFVSKNLINYYLGMKGDAVICEPIDTTVFDPNKFDPREKEKIAQKFGVEKAFPLIISVGILSPRKGFEYLIKAFAIVKKYFPGAKLLIIGDILPSQKKYYFNLRNLVNDFHLDQHIIFTGYVKNQELLGALSLADLFVMASIHEGTPVSILETMAMGLPVVATNVGGVSELVVSNKTGVLVPPQKPQAIADAVIRLLQDQEERSRMGERARERVKEMFTLKKCVGKHADLYQECVKGFADSSN